MWNSPEVERSARGLFERALARFGMHDVPRSFRVHLGIYLVFVVFWIVLWALTGGGHFWPIWPTMGWGLGVAIHGIVVSSRGPGHEHRGFARDAPAVEANAKRGSVRPPSFEPERSSAAPRGVDPGAVASTAGRRRWVTVMFTDISSSTSLNEALGDEEWSRFLGRHRELLRDAFREREGVEVGAQGDGLLARFDSPAHAVLCAIDIQRRIDEIRDGGGLVPRVRIGIHAGEAVADEGDIVGRVVNLAARVTTEAAPGEILVTEPVADELAGRIELEDRGLRPLRGVPQPRHLLAVRWS